MGLLGMSMNILSSLGNLGSTKIILTSNDLFLSTSYREQGCHCVRKARRCPSNHENKRPAAKAGRSVFPQILVGLLPIRNCIWD